MQTFLPYPDFNKVAKCLDYRRLGKQRVEAMQILNILTGKSTKKGWRSHPAVLMWRGFEESLKLYHDIMIQEWIDRGYNNTMKQFNVPDRVDMPYWMGDREFHRSHKSNLLRKDPSYYREFWPNERDDLEYVWPSKRETANCIS
jgi:hypothetical protein